MARLLASAPDDEAQSPSPLEMRFLQIVCARIEREIEILKSRAATGEAIDLVELDDHEHMLSAFVAGLEQLSSEAFDAHVPALGSAKHRGH
jgi:hypothetical protein